MDLLLNIAIILVSLILGTYFSTSEKPKKIKILAWFLCLFIVGGNIYKILKEKKEKNKETKTKEYYFQSIERQELLSRGLPITYVNGLGENPLLKNSFKEGKSYENESKFEEAIEVYKRCESHPKATAENRVEANILIGNCYFWLHEPQKAERYYKEALDISQRIKEKEEIPKAMASALSNLGIILRINKPDKALKYFKEALEIHRKIGDTLGIVTDLIEICHLDKSEESLDYMIEYLEIQKKTGYERDIAWVLGNIGHIYIDLRKPSEALKYSEEALEIHRKIGDTLGELRIATNLESIGSIYSDLRKPDEALKCHTEALEIYKKNGFKLGIVMQLLAISSIYNDLGKFEEALKYSKEAKEIYDKSNINERFRSRLFRNLENDVIEKK